MLRRCRKEWLLLVNGFKKVNCLGGGLRSDRSACVEARKERESMLDTQNDRAGQATQGVPLYG